MNQQQVISILTLCREKPRTLHYIKDKFNFCSQKLKECMNYLVGEGFITVSVVKGDGRGTKQIRTTDKGKDYYLSRSKQTMPIYVDNRGSGEKNLAAYLEGMRYPVEVRHLDSGDIQFDDVGIERKTVSDLIRFSNK